MKRRMMLSRRGIYPHVAKEIMVKARSCSILLFILYPAIDMSRQLTYSKFIAYQEAETIRQQL
jgi:hypothetical protein